MDKEAVLAKVQISISGFIIKRLLKFTLGPLFKKLRKNGTI